jgi:hypothetical protein
MQDAQPPAQAPAPSPVQTDLLNFGEGVPAGEADWGGHFRSRDIATLVADTF